MSFDDPRLFDDPMPVELDSSDRDAVASLLSPVRDADRLSSGSGPFDQGQAELARLLYRQRRQRDQHLPAELLGEPAWDILLILYWARHSRRRLTLAAVCASCGAPGTTGLRYIEHLHRSGFATRIPDAADKTVSWLCLSDDGDQRVGRYLDGILGEGQSLAGCDSAH